MDAQGHEVGKLEDFLVDLSGRRPSFALLTRAKGLKHGETFAVPITLLKAGAGPRLTLDTSEQPLENAPRFSPQAWDERRIYRYTGS